MTHDATVAQMVARASVGDAVAWQAMVDRYAGLVLSVCRQFRLSDQDAQDVSQTVWLRLVERLDSLREPQALAGWLVTSTRNECIAVWRAARRQFPLSPTTAQAISDHGDSIPLDHDLLQEERHLALREAFGQLPERCQTLLSLLFSDPPASYEEISRKLGVSKGSIGPTRARCLDKLRVCPALMAYLRLEDEFSAEGADDRATAVVDGR